MASMIESASNTASSATQQSQAEARTTSSMPDIAQYSLEHNPDIFTIVCCNDSFQLALDLNTIKTLLRVCRHARPLLSSKLPRFHSWCQKAELCNPDGQLWIGLTPSDQIALSLHCKNPDSADRSWLEDQADKGNAAASYFLARILQVDLDQWRVKWPKRRTIKPEIFQHLLNAAKTNHSMAQSRLAEFYHDENFYHPVLCIDSAQAHVQAFELYRNLAVCGITQVQLALGRCYENGDGVDQDYNTAIEWYSKAADQGSEDGRLHIVFLQAWFSFIGHSVEQSDADAFNYWQEVSTKSTDPVIKPIATHMVGWMHYLGRGSQRDQLKGITIIRKNESDEFNLGENECLAAWGMTPCHSPATGKFFELCQFGSDRDWLCRHLEAVCLFHGFGVAEDQKKAAVIFEQLANDDHSDSQLWIGACYLCQAGVSGDHDKAFEWYCKSANQGNPYGQWKLGESYCYGNGVTQDFTKAVEWYRKSAEQGTQMGQEALGHCYQNGYGVHENIDTAAFWYRKLADQGFHWAIDSLKALGKWP